MSSPIASALDRPPWVSLWLQPGRTIERILRRDPKRHVLLLAALYVLADIILRLIESGLTAILLDWRVILAVALVGTVTGAISVYLLAVIFRWTGRLLGGQASRLQLRAVMAWSYVPIIAIFPIVGAIHLLKALTGYQQTSIINITVQVITIVLSIWSIAVTVLMLRRAQGFRLGRAIANLLLAYALLLLLVVAPVLLTRTFLFQPFDTPSGSMKPTLLVGDHFFVSKYAYGASEPQYGDLVVFRLPRDPSTDYVKRVVGLPGDRIQMIGGVLQINGTPIKHAAMEPFAETDANGRTTHVRRWRETLPNGATYTTLDLVDNSFYDNTPVYQVPEGHYFMLGDNLDNSTDSRVQSTVGYIPFENLVGRVAMIFFSVDRESGKQPSVRFDRIGTMAR